MTLVCGDILEEDWSSADLVFSYCTCFSDGMALARRIEPGLPRTGAECSSHTPLLSSIPSSSALLSRIADKCAALKDGAVVVTVSSSLAAPYLTLVSSRELPTESGSATFFVMVKHAAPSVAPDAEEGDTMPAMRSPTNPEGAGS